MSGPGFARLVDLALQLEADAERPAAELRRRDRGIGLELAQAGVPAREQVAAWLARVRPAAATSAGARAATALRAAAGLLAVFGVVLGTGTATALFQYDGTHPVNVVRVLGVFVGLQFLLLAGTALLCLPERWRSRLPGLDAVKDVLALASPGRLIGLLRRILPGSQREAMARFAGVAGRHRRLYGDVEKWIWLSASQVFGVSFHASALAVALALIAFTDLAFGWSTTLQADPRALQRMTRALSLPWSALWPDAVPSAALIESTQYFRGATGAGHDPVHSAPWWRFVAACMVCYGVMPRAALLALARWRLAAAVRRAFRQQPALFALRDRLESRCVETTAEQAEPPAAARAAPTRPALTAAPAGTRWALVSWSGVPASAAEALSRAGWLATAQLRAGEGALETDAAAIAALARTPRDEGVAVLVKAWEPPVLELMDFLRELREVLGEGRVVAVVPLALDAAGQASAPGEASLRTWRRALEQSGDPWLVLHAPELPR